MDVSDAIFTQEDPIGLAGGLNLYGFAGGDPVNFSDPFGLRSCPPDCRPIHAISSSVFGYIGGTVGAGLGASAGTLVLPGGGTISGGAAGAILGAGAGAAFGLGVANVAVDAAELIGNGISELNLPRWIRKWLYPGVIAGGALVGDVTPPPDPKPEEIELEKPPRPAPGSTDPPDERDPESA